jgi:hypothetical protein
MKNLSKICTVLLTASLAACGGGSGGGDDDHYAINAKYIAHTSALNALTTGLQNGDAKDLHDVALEEFYAKEKAKAGMTYNSFSSAADDFVEIANKIDLKAGDTVNGANELAYDQALADYKAQRDSNKFTNNKSMNWDGTYNGKVVATQATISPNNGMTYDWVDRGTIAITLAKSGSNLGATFNLTLSERNPISLSSTDAGKIIYWTKKDGNDVKAIAGSASTGIRNNQVTYFYFNASK